MSKSIASLKILTSSLAIINLTACSSIAEQSAHVATDIGGTFSQMWSNIFTGKLRPAPQPKYAFGSDDALLNTGLLIKNLRHQAIKDKQHLSMYSATPFSEQTKMPVQRPVKHVELPKITADPTQQIYPIDSQPNMILETHPISHRAAIRENIVTAEPINSPHITAHIKENSQIDKTADISYVKIGGGSKVSDWDSCDQESGGYLNVKASSYVIAPKFDKCMRALGYTTEAEAEIELAGKPTPKPVVSTQSVKAFVNKEQELKRLKPNKKIARQIDTTGIPTNRRYPSR